MRLSHVTLFVADIARSRAFYLALGFELVVDAAHYCRFRANLEGAGEETLSIERREGPIAPACQIGFEFVSAAALDACIARLAAAGVDIAEPPTDRGWLWRDARLIDPDGHELMLFFAGDNKLNPPWRVGA